MTKTNYSLLLLISGLVLIQTACKKDADMGNEYLSNKLNYRPTNNLTSVIGIPSYPLDWENIVYMPNPSNTAPVPVPWQSALGGRKIDDDITYDYRKADGWELVYNTFNETVSYNPAYFTLYNKYRGLLRTYFYFTTPSNYPSSNITYLLTLRGSRATASPMLNFAGKDIITVGDNNTNVSQIQPYLVSNTGSWYATEFEIAYDPLLTSTNFQDLQLDWSINPNSINQISLNGIETGTISGTVEQEKAGTNFFTGLTNGLMDAGIKIGSESAGSNIKFLKSSIKDPILSALTNSTGGLIKGFLSGIIGGGSSTLSKQQVNLKINSKIQTTGTSIEQSQIYSNIFTLPGTLDNIYSIPFYPNYNSPMGLFYISNTPIVQIQRNIYNNEFPGTIGGAKTNFSYQLDENSFQTQFNPSLLAIADIQNLRKDLILIGSFDNSLVDRESSSYVEENIAGTEVYGVGSLTLNGIFPTIIAKTGLVVRISFDVVPKNGDKKVTIVKTFQALGQE